MSVNGSPVPDMDALRKHRIRLGASQERVAAKLGVSTKTIHRWEKGYDPGEIKRRRLANLYAEAEAHPEAWAA